jgi:hypothetical protein
MSAERVTYNNLWFDENAAILCRVQTFLFKYLSSKPHPDWFRTILEGINANRGADVGKYFFDEEEIEQNPTQKQYLLKMLDKSIRKIASLSREEFVEYIAPEVEHSFARFYDMEYTHNKDKDLEWYLQTLQNVKKLVQGEQPDTLYYYNRER